MTTKMDIKYVILLLVICGPEIIVAASTTTTQPSTTTTTLALTTNQTALNDKETSTAENATASTVSTNTTDAMMYDEADNTTTTTVAVTPAFATTTTTVATTTRAPFNCTVPGAMCKNNGTCQDSGECDCGENFTGEQCELVRLCNDTSCENNGTCDLHENYGYNCTCVTGDPNANCALNKVEDCTQLPVSASNIHSCIDNIDGYKLLCNQNFTGDECQNRATDDYCTREGPDYCKDIDYCKPLCNLEMCNGTSACNFTIKPFEDPVFISKPDCRRDFGNGFAVYPTGKCQSEEALFDAFDKVRSHLKDCSPYFNTICAFSFANGTCDERCNNKDCLWDGWDCANTLHVQPLPVSGRLVVELRPFGVTEVNKTAHVKKVLGLLLRSKLDVVLTTKPVPHVHIRVSSTNFTKISAVGRFVAAAISTMPYLGLEVTDVFVCENGTYSATYSDKCSLKCSPNCRPIAGQDYCDVMTGTCTHGCMGGYFGPMCNKSCPPSCADACDSDGICKCESGSYWSEAGKSCIPCSTNCGNTCDPRHGSCTCKPKFYGKLCVNNCSPDCLGGTCGMDGKCSGGCVKGHYGPWCRLTCPDRCPECAQDTGGCQGKCIAGYEGQDCNKSVMPPPPVTDNTGVIIAVILAIVIVVIIVFAAYCCWKRRQSGDYVLGDEEGESTPKMTGMGGGGGGAETQGAIMMQPHKPDLGKSTDMIDMDEGHTGAGIYQGPNRQTVVATNITDITANDYPTKEVNANGDVVVNGNVDTEQETSQRASLTIDVGMTVDADMVDSGERTSADVIPAEVTIQVDVDEDGETPRSPEKDMAMVPLHNSLAPLASEENILLSKENLLADTDTAADADIAAADNDKPDVGADAEPEEDKPSSRKSSTSSKSSKSSSSSKSSRSRHSSHSSTKSDVKRDSKAGEPTTEM